MEQTIFNAIIGIAAFFGGWVLNSITKTMDRLDKDVRDMPRTYVTKDDYHRDIDDIKSMLEKIFNRLDKKADKTL